jgi:phosphoribosylformimino-5-aminoimidazole carboxamide ribotide isomerase
MILFPAIDIKDGKCVRLRQGKYNDVTVFSSDPVEMAMHWYKQGARYLHVVDLDGAFEGKPKNYSLIANICRSVDIPVQLGGGIRSFDIARQYIDAGVFRIIIGTMFLEDRDGFIKICREFSGKVGVSLDAENGRLKARGWVKDTSVEIISILPDVMSCGASFIVYTDISRDGMQTGINPDPIKNVLQYTELPVIAAGGVKDIEDIKALYPLTKMGLEGVITGRAIYEGSLNFKEANEWILAQEKSKMG